MLFQEILDKYRVKCSKCGGAPQQVDVEDAPAHYKTVKCSGCGQDTCIDTNEVVVWQDWAFKNRAE